MAPKNSTPATLSLQAMISQAVAAAMAGMAAETKSTQTLKTDAQLDVGNNAHRAAPREDTAAPIHTELSADGTLTVRVKLAAPRLSSTGKMQLCAATGWRPTSVKLANGKTLRVTLSAGCYAVEK